MMTIIRDDILFLHNIRPPATRGETRQEASPSFRIFILVFFVSFCFYTVVKSTSSVDPPILKTMLQMYVLEYYELLNKC